MILLSHQKPLDAIYGSQIDFSKILFVIITIDVGMGTDPMGHAWRSEDNLEEPVLPFLLFMGLGVKLRRSDFCGKCLSLSAMIF